MPWYKNPSTLFIIFGCVTIAVGAWFVFGKPGAPQQSGEYSCLLTDEYETMKGAEAQGMPFVFDPRSPGWVATFNSSGVSEVQAFDGTTNLGTVPTARPVSEFSYGEMLSPSEFSMRVEGQDAVCYQ